MRQTMCHQQLSVSLITDGTAASSRQRVRAWLRAERGNALGGSFPVGRPGNFCLSYVLRKRIFVIRWLSLISTAACSKAGCVNWTQIT